MREFEKILKMNQKELKAFLKGYLEENNYPVVDKDGFLYAKGDLRVLLVAHMDRYPDQGDRVLFPERYKDHENIEIYETTDGKTIKPLSKSAQIADSQSQTIEDFYKAHYPCAKLDSIKSQFDKKTAESKTVWMSPQGICADDRAGVWCIMQLLKKYHPSVLFTEDEEIKKDYAEEHGSVKFCKSEYIKKLDVNFMIQIDRKNFDDAVFYNCGNEDFKIDIVNMTGYNRISDIECRRKKRSTDIRYLMPKCNIAGVNLSCGYYNEHYPEEFVVIEEMQHTVSTVEKLLNGNFGKVYSADCTY